MSQEEIIEKEGMVILLDRLGSKGIWKDGDTTHVISDWLLLMAVFKSYLEDIQKKFPYKFFTFSDTVVITMYGSESEELFNDMCSTIIPMFAAAMAQKIFFRGGFNFGKYYDPEQMLLGPAVDELSQYYTLPEWIGISAAPSAHRVLDKMEKNKNIISGFVKYDVPLKNSIEKNGWAINWPNFTDQKLKDLGTHLKTRTPFNNTIELIDEQLKGTIDIQTSFKWRNTENFVLAMKKKVI